MDDNKFLKITMGAVFATWVLVSLGVYVVGGPGWTERGQFGDMFGAVNALFSGMAFAGLLYTIVLQQKQLSMQREELALQREEMRASRGELENQTRAQNAMFKATVADIQLTASIAQIDILKLRRAEEPRPFEKSVMLGEMVRRGNELEDLVAMLIPHDPGNHKATQPSEIPEAAAEPTSAPS
ncbi:MAG: hypothetical protein WAW73_20340 [Rhodoferax sp.]